MVSINLLGFSSIKLNNVFLMSFFDVRSLTDTRRLTKENKYSIGVVSGKKRCKLAGAVLLK